MLIDSFIDPYSKQPLRRDGDGNLHCRVKDVIRTYQNYGGTHDFVLKGTELWKEREHYDEEYKVVPFEELTENSLRDSWYAGIYPWRKTLLDSLGELRDKKMLIVGCGESYKEYYFLTRGARVVFTDLSLEAVKHMRDAFTASGLYKAYCERVEFHAVDALNLPFQDGEFDIIYGAAFVHHLEDMNPFLSEVNRCLKEYGICRFIDQADAPLWSFLKRTILLPFKVYSHWKHPRSPEDLKAEKREGYTYEKMAVLMKRYGFREMVFVREWFLLRIVGRHYGMFFNYSSKAMRRGQKLFLTMKWLDRKLAHTKWMKKNTLTLTWGFNK